NSGFMEYEETWEEINLPTYSYFQIGPDGTVTQLEPHRLFPETEFVKLDSTYLTGDFRVYDPDIQDNRTAHFLSIKTVTLMRDEILASYAYRFPDEERIKLFQDLKGARYSPTFESIDEFAEGMTAIDKHNLAFLNKIIDLMKPIT